MLRRLTLALGSTLLALGGLELWARATWVAPWHEQLISEQTYNQRHEYTTNAHGLRDRDYPSPKPADRLRLMILGDSFTHGTGVFEDELVFPELLEVELNRLDWASHTGVDVLNAGLSGSIPRQWAKLWRELADDFDPDAVLIVFFLRDGTSFGSSDYFEYILNGIAVPNRKSQAYQRSYLYRWLRDLHVKREVLEQYRTDFVRAYFGTKQETRLWSRAKRHLRDITESARERGATVGLSAFPILVDLEGDYPFQDIVDEVLGFGEAEGLPTLDLTPAFAGQVATDLWVSPVDQHPNAEGHRLAAEALLPFARGLLLEAASR